MTDTQSEAPAPGLVHLGGHAFAHPDLVPLLTDATHLHAYPGNPRVGDTSAIADSIRVNGLYRPVYGQRSTGAVLAGNHTFAAAVALGATRVPVVWLDVDDDQAKRIVLADNRTADLGAYDDRALAQLLVDLNATADQLVGTGYTDDDLTELLALVDLEPVAPGGDGEPGEGLALVDDDEAEPSSGELLALADVTWAEPVHEVHHGQVWQVGRHTLVVARLSDEHHVWTGLLTPEHLFAPYPEVYITASQRAAQSPLLLVQPNKFVAGHLLDKHASMYPDEPVRLLEGAA